MAMYSPNRSNPSVRPGQDGSSRDRGMSDYFDMREQPNKARVDGRLQMMMNEAGHHARRAPKVDILR